MNIKVNGIELYYEVIGSGAPLIMVHGNGETHEIFHEAAEVLSGYFTCYLIDSRGHGESEAVSEFHYEDMAEDIHKCIEALQLEQVTYYGFSDGGIIGILLACKYPDLFERMIISGANTHPKAIKKLSYLLFKITAFFNRSPLYKLMLTEPHITKEQLNAIRIPTLVLAGDKDVVQESDTYFIAENIPDAALQILHGESHGSYIVHNTKVAELILEYCGK